MTSEKIRPHHPERKAILYVRQSSAQQVMHNRESRALQYAMRDRQTALGWSRIETVDDHLNRAREVGAGNYALRVAGRTGPDEIGLLNRAFNRMTAQIERQTDALIGANRQLGHADRGDRDVVLVADQLIELFGACALGVDQRRGVENQAGQRSVSAEPTQSRSSRSSAAHPGSGRWARSASFAARPVPLPAGPMVATGRPWRTTIRSRPPKARRRSSRHASMRSARSTSS